MRSEFIKIITGSRRRQVKDLVEALLESKEEIEEYSKYNPDLDESSLISDPKVVKEKGGEGLSLLINGIEYRYVSDNLSAKELLSKVEGMMKHSPGKALAWLKQNSVNYYGGKDKRYLTKDQKLSRVANESYEVGGIYTTSDGDLYVVEVIDDTITLRNSEGNLITLSLDDFGLLEPIFKEKYEEGSVIKFNDSMAVILSLNDDDIILMEEDGTEVEVSYTTILG